MLEKLFNLVDCENSVKEFCDNVHQGIPSVAFGVTESFRSFMVSAMRGQIIYLVKDGISARKSKAQIEQFCKRKVVYLPPKDELLLITKAFSKDTLYDRIIALNQLKTADIVITTVESLMQPIPSEIHKLVFNKDQDFNREEAIKRLTDFGYYRVDGVESKGTFCVRGDVIDVFPINEEDAFRIDFFGDTVESIKKIDAETRKNLGAENSLEIIQASEYIFDELTDTNYLLSVLRQELSECSAKAKPRMREVFDELYERILNRDNDSLAVVSPLLAQRKSVLDCIQGSATIVFDEAKRCYELTTLIEREYLERFESLSKAGEVFSFMESGLLSLEYVKNRIKDYKLGAIQSLSTTIPFFNPLHLVNCSVSAMPDYHLDFNEVYNDVSNWLYSGYKVLICAGEVRRAENLCFELSGKGIASALNGKIFNGAVVTNETLSKGFIYHEEKIAVIGTGNLYVKTSEKIKRKTKKQSFFTAPEVGDYCVHETHGIGKVLGSRKISTTEGTKDYISVEYYGGDILHIPVEQMDILTRYLGGDKTPRLSKIGGKDFEKIKRQARESIKKMSFDLKKLYSERKSLKGFKFQREEELQKAFDDAFEFDETIDQLQAEQDIVADMTEGRVMDRLVCGDVGFGKTEVAFRAIFLCVANGKQAVLLAPTTILAEQHYSTAVKRFSDFGIRIACLNRFRTAKQQQDIIERAKKGEIDLVIGTHRLLSKDVGFFDLGLLVLDEEQRFGVEHKEKIKLLKKNVDTLTLSATPIPRTLHMSLTGIREISTINTPPKKRLPVQTYVTEQTDMLIVDAVKREVNRGGQVFILYNRVETIYKFADYVKSLLPDVKATVVHGQMDEREMERGIVNFYKGESDVLISTTIIENGIDLPRANTLIVIDADYLGLSTLYQLKGRVGRSDRLAYAYFTFRKEKILSNTAYERLNAITDFTEMGSGIKIAMRDLEIRGAGNVLGAEQHGHMDKIGYELYSKLLKEELSGVEEVIPELDIRVSAYIPDKYIESTVSRMDAYKQIAEINTKESEQEFIDFATDVYGKIPVEVYNLINIAVVKTLAMKVGVSLVTVTKEDVSLTFSTFKCFSNPILSNVISEYKGMVTLSMETSPKLKFNFEKSDNGVSLWNLREFLAKTYEEK